MISIKAYEQIEDELKSIYRSRLQTQVLLSLKNEKKSLLELREITGSSSQAIIPKIRKLEARHIVETDGYCYRLTPLGGILANKIKEFIMTMGVLSRFENFWGSHHVEGIAEPLLNDIGELFESVVVRDTSQEFFKAFNNYLNYLRGANHIFVVSSFTSIELISAVIERLAEGIPVEIVITRDVFKLLDKEPYSKNCHEMLEFPNLNLMVTDEYVRIGLTVTENFLSMGLYKKDGSLYDFSEDLFSFDQKAIKWGKKFFQYYKDRSFPASQIAKLNTP